MWYIPISHSYGTISQRFGVNGSHSIGCQATGPHCSNRQWTVLADITWCVTILPCCASIVDVTVQFITAMHSKGLSSLSDVTACAPGPSLQCAETSSVRGLQIHVMVLAFHPVHAAISWYDKPPSLNPIIHPLSNSINHTYGYLILWWGMRMY